MAKKIPKIATGKSGGVFFFLSLLSLLILGTLSCLMLPTLLNKNSFVHLSLFAAASATGIAGAHFLIKGRISVFIHEFKHSLISNFAGNRAKGMKIKSNSGHFTYEFTKETAHLNAFIALAPYWVPLFTVPAIALGYAFWRHDHITMIFIAGMAFGADLLLNTRDISPVQTDLTNIRGGYQVGLIYALAMNVTITSLLLAWVLQGPAGLLQIAQGAMYIFERALGRSTSEV